MGMKRTAPFGLSLAIVAVLFGTVLVFMAFDRNSHSASDTLRPFVITMAPVWALVAAAAMIVFRRVRPS